MVSDVSSIRLWSQQAALRAFRDASTDTASGMTASSGAATSLAATSLADVLYAGDNDDGDEDTTLSNLIASLRQQAMTGTTATDDTSDDGSVDDISSKAFMKALTAKIEELKASPSTAEMAETMLAALADGTLTVTDATAGATITAWDPSADDAEPTTKTTTETADWSSFLKNHLARETNGLYVRNDDSSHQDKLTGASSYFGMIGETYYYLSWSAAVKK